MDVAILVDSPTPIQHSQTGVQTMCRQACVNILISV